MQWNQFAGRLEQALLNWSSLSLELLDTFNPFLFGISAVVFLYKFTHL